MKKFIPMALALVCAFAIGATGRAEAETGVDIDLTSLTLEQLVELHKIVDAELDARIGVEPSTIADGVYIAGKTIKSGAYALTCSEVYGEGMMVNIYQSEAGYSLFLSGNGDQYLIYSGVITEDQKATVSLTDSMVMVLDGGAALIEAGAQTWAP